MTPTDPLVLEVGCKGLPPALRDLGLAVRSVPSVSSALNVLRSLVPRVTVLHERAASARGGSIDTIHRACRGEAPLTDVLLWAPDASPAMIRDALRAGIRDVVLSPDPAAMATAAREVIDSQQVLPRVQHLSQARQRSRFEGLVSRSSALWEVFETALRVAPTEANVLILGETGTGKELLARAIHTHSRRAGRFVAINCGAVSEQLIEAELFGHEKGAFTGAVRAKRGLFRHADQGTLLLDELGNLPQSAQLSLLRALQEGAVRPVGSAEEVPVNVRVLAATSLPLDRAARDGSFREDLLYRLDVIRLLIPPLRERPEDVLFLFSHFRKQLSKHHGIEPPQLHDSFLEAMLAYDWPGNVRELENFTERLLLTRRGGVLHEHHFERLKRPYRRERSSSSEPSRPRTATAPPAPRPAIDLERPLQALLTAATETLERDYLRAALARTRGRIQEAADLSGLSRRTLLRKLKQHGIDKRSFKPR
ncbi:MAG: sigma-54 dependent transcriptional regulator [Planctomycetota bacterium]